jgi:LPS sulfotransferase NodH
MADFAREWGVCAQTIDAFDQSYVDTALSFGAAETGCFGMRIMWNNVPPLIARLGQLYPSMASDHDLLQAALGPLKFIHLARADKVAEAVSLDIAEQSGLWHRNADGTERERTTNPAQPTLQLRRILSFIGADPDKANSATPQRSVLSADINRAWAARFRKETGLAPPPPAP